MGPIKNHVSIEKNEKQNEFAFHASILSLITDNLHLLFSICNYFPTSLCRPSSICLFLINLQTIFQLLQTHITDQCSKPSVPYLSLTTKLSPVNNLQNGCRSDELKNPNFLPQTILLSLHLLTPFLFCPNTNARALLPLYPSNTNRHSIVPPLLQLQKKTEREIPVNVRSPCRFLFNVCLKI